MSHGKSGAAVSITVVAEPTQHVAIRATKSSQRLKKISASHSNATSLRSNAALKQPSSLAIQMQARGSVISRPSQVSAAAANYSSTPSFNLTSNS